MAHSRLERIGTIYTRITGLIRSGAMKLEERPLWYEIYQAFPPATPPHYDNPPPKGDIRDIFYPEDAIRAKFYKKSSFATATNLRDDGRPSPCQTFLDKCKRLAASKGVAMDEVFDEAFASTKEEFIAFRLESNKGVRSRAPSEKNVQTKSSVEINDIFAEESDKTPSGTSESKTSQ